MKSRLDKLAVFISDAYNNGIGNGIEFDGDWLQYQIDSFNSKIKIVDLDILTNSIDAYIDNRGNLSRGSLKNLDKLKKFVINYEKDALKGK